VSGKWSTPCAAHDLASYTGALTYQGTRHPGTRDVNVFMADHRDQINSVVDHRRRAEVITSVLNEFRRVHGQHAEAMAYLDSRERAIRSTIANGTTQALRELASLFESNRDLLRTMTTGYDPESERLRDLEVADRLADYLASRVRGTSAADAAEQLLERVEEWARHRRSGAPSPSSAGSPRSGAA
jgi:hypothetical protein